ncbi:RlmE family RNA methyltransferase [Buchnera aphidicola]|uniref:Ribosomal RNA large subunit methyltransferase E n=1 Tax=Buchnera aphidicola (Therioaphis trifolii) TaxID=1241884 RepID=A0A4D6YN07_9GAMM|nr:SAM-dependent methyltransferase [Buchnera aphidicola]QCI27248.1 rRNA methyltransferase [Buchnera aphidicola (Therioaphis trifolii)]
MKKKKSSSSKRWLLQHFKDPFVKQSYNNNFRSRAWFKLHDINLKYHLFKMGMNVIDLGSSPGSWSKYAIKKIGKHGCVISCDINDMKPIPGVFFFKGNILKTKILNQLLKFIQNKKIHLIMSDMSPNITGISSIDIPKSLFLSKLALNIALTTLSNNGVFLLKIFQGLGVKDFLNKLRTFFSIIKICKPNASRSCSREVFILARGFKK